MVNMELKDKRRMIVLVREQLEFTLNDRGIIEDIIEPIWEEFWPEGTKLSDKEDEAAYSVFRDILEIFRRKLIAKLRRTHVNPRRVGSGYISKLPYK